jgi:hypothetical protein
MSVMITVGFAGSFDQHDAQLLRSANHLVDAIGATGRQGDSGDPPRRQKILDELLRAAVDRYGVSNNVAGFKIAKNAVMIAAMPELNTKRGVGAGLEREGSGPQKISALG